jgi:3-hydroxyacyl-CoA dehydrogenase/enoyl-CoA hydratase/3-hydroxybutyryl-CoA epimerase
LVIEAIAENVEAKSALFAGIESSLRPAALLATNTSSIPLEVLARSLRDPSRLVGLFFFNPVTKMQLVEIVRGAQTSEKTVAQARAFTVTLKRLPLNVNSSPGFLVNRVLMSYLIEAMRIVEEGVPFRLIDRAATEFGMPMGPVLLADTIGLDICLAAAETIASALAIPVPEKLRAIAARGELGKKTGKGFYTYKKGRPLIEASIVKETNIPVTERLVLRLLNEAMACLREGVVTDPQAVDAGLVYGIGFAPYLGGPMRYAESLGGAGVLQSLNRLAQKYGAEFEPDTGWYKTELFTRRAALRN